MLELPPRGCKSHNRPPAGLKAVLVTTSGLVLLAVGLWLLMQGDGDLRPGLATCVLGAILALYPLGTRL
jgi:hypothetical protein